MKTVDDPLYFESKIQTLWREKDFTIDSQLIMLDGLCSWLMTVYCWLGPLALWRWRTSNWSFLSYQNQPTYVKCKSADTKRSLHSRKIFRLCSLKPNTLHLNRVWLFASHILLLCSMSKLKFNFANLDICS